MNSAKRMIDTKREQDKRTLTKLTGKITDTKNCMITVAPFQTE